MNNNNSTTRNGRVVRSNLGRSQRIPVMNARAHRGRGVAVYPATFTSSSTAGDWVDLIFRKLLLGRVYGVKAILGWFGFWMVICGAGAYLTGNAWWLIALGAVCVLKGVIDVHEESADMKEKMRERYGESWDKDLPVDGGYGYGGGYGGTGSVYDGVGGFGCSPHGFFGWEVPCAAAKADMEMMGFTFGKNE